MNRNTRAALWVLFAAAGPFALTTGARQSPRIGWPRCGRWPA